MIGKFGRFRLVMAATNLVAPGHAFVSQGRVFINRAASTANCASASHARLISPDRSVTLPPAFARQFSAIVPVVRPNLAAAVA